MHRIVPTEATRTGLLSRTTLQGGGAPRIVATLHLECNGEQVELKTGKLSIGRSPNCDFQTMASTASREHGTFEYKNQKFFYTDQSTNGTYYCRDGEDPLRLLRESTIISGRGKLGIGFLPDGDMSDAPGAINFRIVAEIIE